MPFSDDYVRSKFTHKDEQGIFRLDNLNPPGGRGPVYEFTRYYSAHGAILKKRWKGTR